VERFEPRREGAFLAYLRQVLLNAVRGEIRTAARRPSGGPLDEALVDPAPVLKAIGADILETYENALEALPEIQREAVVLRVEFGYGYGEIAEAIESPSVDAARMMVARALVRLTELMNEADHE
jgi:RNA polymerase sigma-70 factor (ECF subfamily)